MNNEKVMNIPTWSKSKFFVSRWQLSMIQDMFVKAYVVSVVIQLGCYKPICNFWYYKQQQVCIENFAIKKRGSYYYKMWQSYCSRGKYLKPRTLFDITTRYNSECLDHMNSNCCKINYGKSEFAKQNWKKLFFWRTKCLCNLLKPPSLKSGMLIPLLTLVTPT